MIGIPGVEKLRACLARLLPRGSSGGAGVVLEEPQIVAPPKRLRLLCFLLKNGSSKKTFGRAPLKEPEPEPERSPAKQALSRRMASPRLLGVSCFSEHRLARLHQKPLEKPADEPCQRGAKKTERRKECTCALFFRSY